MKLKTTLFLVVCTILLTGFVKKGEHAFTQKGR